MSLNNKAAPAETPVSEADHVELSRLVTEHAWRTDNGHADTLHELYVEDGELLLPNTPLRGRAAIREWGEQLAKRPPWRSIRHVCANMRFVYDGPNHARGSAILVVFMVAGTDAVTTIPWNVGEDHDQFVRTREGWRLVSREWVELFTRGDTVNLR